MMELEAVRTERLEEESANIKEEKTGLKKKREGQDGPPSKKLVDHRSLVRSERIHSQC